MLNYSVLLALLYDCIHKSPLLKSTSRFAMHSKISLYNNVILMSAVHCLPLKLLDCFLLSKSL